MKKKPTSKTRKTRKPADLPPRSSSRDVKGGVVIPGKIEYPNLVLKQGTSN